MREVIIFRLYPQVKSINRGNECLDANGEVVDIDEALVATEIQKDIELKERNSYKEKRRKEYPTVDEVIGELFDSGALNYHIKRRVGLRRIHTKRAEVKLKYPKPSN